MSDIEGRCFVKRMVLGIGPAFVPADFAAEEFLAEIAEGKEVILSCRQPRSPQHHRWFFAMLRKVVENTDGKWGDEEDLLDDLKRAVGHVRRSFSILTGEERIEARSINFASMGELAFRRFKKRCVFVLTAALGWDPEALMNETDETQAPSIAPSQSREREREPV